MNIEIHAKKLKLTDEIKKYVDEKIGRLTKYEKKIMNTRVNLISGKERSSDTKYRAEVTMHLPEVMIRSEEKAQDIFAAIDLVGVKLERQLDKYKGRHFWKSIKAEKFSKIAGEVTGKITGKSNGKIVKRKIYETTNKPMTEAEAIEQMELLGHPFFLFLNTQTGKHAVVYKRDDGNYGIIEPESEI